MANSRRPIRARSNSLVKKFASFLDRSGLTPNSISLASIGFSAFSGLAAGFGFWWLTAVGIQLRLLCNLFDGMVAVEGGKSTPSGGVYNEVPDRVSDTLTFVGVGYGCGYPQLGLWCALAAALTAYVRVLGVSLGTQHFFFGPLAKQQRMGLMTVSLVVAPWWSELLLVALTIVLLGSVLTCMRRLRAVCRELEASS